MNKQRRKDLAVVLLKIEEIRGTFESVIADLENIRDEEQDYFDNMPENMQQADKGTTAEEAISNLEHALDSLGDLDLDTIISSIESAQE